MKPYLVHTPGWLQSLYPKRIWRRPEQDTVYLTFDDGPIPELTPWVLDELARYKAKATFFVIGDNVRKHPDVLEQVIAAGHSIGNHTFHHLKQPKVTDADYLEDIDLCAQQLAEHGVSTQLFRPPYGKLKSGLAKTIRQRGYQIVMWDVLSADFDTAIDGQTATKNVLNHIRPGSLVVFHDSLKAKDRLTVALPKVLDYIKDKGWKCAALD